MDNWRDQTKGNERKFFTKNQRSSTNWRSRNQQNADPQQNQSDRPRIRSITTQANAGFGSSGRFNNSNVRTRFNEPRESDLTNLEKCLDEEPEELILKLLRQSSWFSKLVQSTSNLSPDCIVLIVRLLARMSDCSFTTNTNEILKIASTDVFLLQLSAFIMLLPHQKEEERKEASYFWNDPNSFFQNLSEYFEMVLSLSPSVAVDILPKLMQAILATTPHLNVLLDETKQLFEVIREKLKVCKQEVYFQRKKKNMAIDDEMEPPDDFRLISLYPLPTEITDRKRAFVRPNIIEGSYRDVDHYLDVQFRLLREDFVKPLREGICDYMDGSNHKLQNIRVYKNVTFLGPAAAPTNGIFGVLVQLDIKDKTKYRQKIENSRRFMFGSLVCFTTNNFNSVIFGKIISRDIPLLTKGQLIIEFEEGNSNIEYNVNCTMVESNVYFEPYYHVLKVLQNLRESTFPMKEYIVNVNKEIEPPRYPTSGVRKFLLYWHDELTMEASSGEDEFESYLGLQIHEGYVIPLQDAISKLNETQLQAFEYAMTNSLSVIQGPPGTGKTHLGLIIARSLLRKKSEWYHGCYPLLVVCFTNHALDQFLEGLLGTTTEIVRIGGQSKNTNLDYFNIKERRRKYIKSRSPAFSNARNHMQWMHNELQDLYKDIKITNEFCGVVNILGTLKNLPELQGTWFEDITPKDFKDWLLQGKAYFQRRPIQKFKQTQMDNLHYQGNGEAVANIPDDPNKERYLDLDDIFTNNITSSSSLYIISVDQLLRGINSLYVKRRDLETYAEDNYEEILKLDYEITSWENTKDYLEMKMADGEYNIEFQSTALIDFFEPMSIHPNDRWSLYFYWLGLFKMEKMEEIAEFEKKYRSCYEMYEELRAIEDLRIMRKQLVVGMTTTSAARLQGSLRALKSPIVIVEEAAEIMESHVIASLTKHCGHLILIGDHQQLRPNTADYTMEKKFNLGISLFERLIINKIPCNVLNVQHRMRPEIAKLISPNIYPNLENHKSVYKFPPVLGVESSLFFITHTKIEERCMDESKSNLYEAEFLLHLAKYLLLNGYNSEDITIIAAYSGQMFLMHRERSRFDILEDVRITVLDNYQGEESKIILLSLVRNNDEGKIGFLSIENRVCVALSRAREGLYVMGNIDMLTSNSDLWKNIRTVLEEQNSLRTSLPLQCQNHPDKVTYITSIDDFSKVPEGGCDKICDKLLNCGHFCKSQCHILDKDHEFYKCKEECKVLCDDGHVCPKLCYEECGKCMVLVPRKLECGHEMKYHCSEVILNCQYPVSAELPCKHKIDNKPCYQDVGSYRCPFPCEARLDKCGHACTLRCHINDDPDHLTYKCYKNCIKYRRNCTMKTEKHICPKLCYEDCPVCEIKIRKERSCSHFFDVFCPVNVESKCCTKPCKKILSCGHPCALKCNQVCGGCTKKVMKIIPECNHEILIECCKTPTKSQCRNNCPIILPCGHGCKEKCSEKCTTLCTELVNSTDSLLCGHHSKIPCHVNNNDYLKQPNMLVHCKQPCSAILECGHVCSGSCGECFQGRIHKICQQKCDAELICGHKCTLLCNQPCQPCVLQPCMRKCSHGKCKNKCGNACRPCRSSCARRCKHVKCVNFCGLKCSVPPCEEPCMKKLPCTHQCIGFCGEPCPPLCIKCNKDELFTFSIGDNEEEGARFVLLQECNHVVENKGMNNWLETDKIGVKKCPACLMPLTATRRFNDQIQDSIPDIQKVKNIFFGDNRENKSLQNLLYMRLEQNYINSKILGQVSKMYENIYNQIKKNLKRKQTMTNILGKILTSKIQILEDITRLFNDSTSERKTSKCIEYIDLLLRRLMQNENRITDQEVIDYTMEIKRLGRMLQLDDFEQIYPSVLQEDLFKSLNEKLYSYSRYNTDDDVIVGEDLKKLCETIGGDISILKDVYLQEIVKAVGVKYGIWCIRKCPNGHKRATENFSEIITESDCKTCKIAAIRRKESRVAI